MNFTSPVGSGAPPHPFTAVRFLATATLLAGLLPAPVHAQPTAASQADAWQFGAVLDVAASRRPLALGQRDRGFALGHSDVSASGPLGAHLQAQVTAAVHRHEGRTEFELEEAWLQTRTLPGGLTLRAGRFASQAGYLNELHPHADDFVERPLLYRAFLGSHWNDDGVRLNWTAPTDLYLRLGAEAFRGRRLVRDTASAGSPGVAVLSAKLGGDLGTSHGWQAGLSFVHNRREAAIPSGAGHHDEGHEETHGEQDEVHGHDEHAGHAHTHGAALTGRRMWIGEVAWKWAPQGNNSRQQVRLAYEIAQVRGLNRFATGSDRHQAQYLSAVWRFAPGWEVGARHDLLRARMPHEDHVDDGRLRESALMLAWKPTHAQTVRLQLTRQRNGGGFDEAARSVQLQYVLGFGAHPAHAF